MASLGRSAGSSLAGGGSGRHLPLPSPALWQASTDQPDPASQAVDLGATCHSPHLDGQHDAPAPRQPVRCTSLGVVDTNAWSMEGEGPCDAIQVVRRTLGQQPPDLKWRGARERIEGDRGGEWKEVGSGGGHCQWWQRASWLAMVRWLAVVSRGFRLMASYPT
ncbi:Os02g0304400 [Oryza sativa Japonica Group]|uniref:Os02g0304400 protein n=1 Tax=Oryza sativa subsp. japonica TaxID=39947 RepID=A0A0P0VI03_ORYSJ|nr:Os02g0304400 [Oryza sativa Japonica Group]